MQFPPPRNAGKQFYILAISQKSVRLFACDFENVLEMRLSGKMPRSVQDITKYIVEEKVPQVHTVSGKGMMPAGIPHGNRAGSGETKIRIEEYFRLINEGLSDILRNEKAPLILAAVDYLIPIYRRVSTYPRILVDSLPGNPDRLTGRDLRDRAVSIMRRELAKERYGLPA